MPTNVKSGKVIYEILSDLHQESLLAEDSKIKYGKDGDAEFFYYDFVDKKDRSKKHCVQVNGDVRIVDKGINEKLALKTTVKGNHYEESIQKLIGSLTKILYKAQEPQGFYKDSGGYHFARKLKPKVKGYPISFNEENYYYNDDGEFFAKINSNNDRYIKLDLGKNEDVDVILAILKDAKDRFIQSFDEASVVSEYEDSPQGHSEEDAVDPSNIDREENPAKPGAAEALGVPLSRINPPLAPKKPPRQRPTSTNQNFLDLGAQAYENAMQELGDQEKAKNYSKLEHETGIAIEFESDTKTLTVSKEGYLFSYDKNRDPYTEEIKNEEEYKKHVAKLNFIVFQDLVEKCCKHVADSEWEQISGAKGFKVNVSGTSQGFSEYEFVITKNGEIYQKNTLSFNGKFNQISPEDKDFAAKIILIRNQVQRDFFGRRVYKYLQDCDLSEDGKVKRREGEKGCENEKAGQISGENFEKGDSTPFFEVECNDGYDDVSYRIYESGEIRQQSALNNKMWVNIAKTHSNFNGDVIEPIRNAIPQVKLVQQDAASERSFLDPETSSQSNSEIVRQQNLFDENKEKGRQILKYLQDELQLKEGEEFANFTIKKFPNSLNESHLGFSCKNNEGDIYHYEFNKMGFGYFYSSSSTWVEGSREKVTRDKASQEIIPELMIALESARLEKKFQGEPRLSKNERENLLYRLRKNDRYAKKSSLKLSVAKERINGTEEFVLRRGILGHEIIFAIKESGHVEIFDASVLSQDQIAQDLNSSLDQHKEYDEAEFNAIFHEIAEAIESDEKTIEDHKRNSIDQAANNSKKDQQKLPEGFSDTAIFYEVLTSDSQPLIGSFVNDGLVIAYDNEKGNQRFCRISDDGKIFEKGKRKDGKTKYHPVTDSKKIAKIIAEITNSYTGENRERIIAGINSPSRLTKEKLDELVKQKGDSPRKIEDISGFGLDNGAEGDDENPDEENQFSTSPGVDAEDQTPKQELSDSEENLSSSSQEDEQSQADTSKAKERNDSFGQRDSEAQKPPQNLPDVSGEDFYKALFDEEGVLLAGKKFGDKVQVVVEKSEGRNKARTYRVSPNGDIRKRSGITRDFKKVTDQKSAISEIVNSSENAAEIIRRINEINAANPILINADLVSEISSSQENKSLSENKYFRHFYKSLKNQELTYRGLKAKVFGRHPQDDTVFYFLSDHGEVSVFKMRSFSSLDVILDKIKDENLLKTYTEYAQREFCTLFSEYIEDYKRKENFNQECIHKILDFYKFDPNKNYIYRKDKSYQAKQKVFEELDHNKEWIEMGPDHVTQDLSELLIELQVDELKKNQHDIEPSDLGETIESLNKIHQDKTFDKKSLNIQGSRDAFTFEKEFLGYNLVFTITKDSHGDPQVDVSTNLIQLRDPQSQFQQALGQELKGAEKEIALREFQALAKKDIASYEEHNKPQQDNSGADYEADQSDKKPRKKKVMFKDEPEVFGSDTSKEKKESSIDEKPDHINSSSNSNEDGKKEKQNNKPKKDAKNMTKELPQNTTPKDFYEAICLDESGNKDTPLIGGFVEDSNVLEIPYFSEKGKEARTYRISPQGVAQKAMSQDGDTEYKDRGDGDYEKDFSAIMSGVGEDTKNKIITRVGQIIQERAQGASENDGLGSDAEENHEPSVSDDSNNDSISKSNSEGESDGDDISITSADDENLNNDDSLNSGKYSSEDQGTGGVDGGVSGPQDNLQNIKLSTLIAGNENFINFREQDGSEYYGLEEGNLEKCTIKKTGNEYIIFKSDDNTEANLENPHDIILKYQDVFEVKAEKRKDLYQKMAQAFDSFNTADSLIFDDAVFMKNGTFEDQEEGEVLYKQSCEGLKEKLQKKIDLVSQKKKQITQDSKWNEYFDKKKQQELVAIASSDGKYYCDRNANIIWDKDKDNHLFFPTVEKAIQALDELSNEFNQYKKAAQQPKPKTPTSQPTSQTQTQRAIALFNEAENSGIPVMRIIEGPRCVTSQDGNVVICDNGEVQYLSNNVAQWHFPKGDEAIKKALDHFEKTTRPEMVLGLRLKEIHKEVSDQQSSPDQKESFYSSKDLEISVTDIRKYNGEEEIKVFEGYLIIGNNCFDRDLRRVVTIDSANVNLGGEHFKKGSEDKGFSIKFPGDRQQRLDTMQNAVNSYEAAKERYESHAIKIQKTYRGHQVRQEIARQKIAQKAQELSREIDQYFIEGNLKEGLLFEGLSLVYHDYFSRPILLLKDGSKISINTYGDITQEENEALKKNEDLKIEELTEILSKFEEVAKSLKSQKAKKQNPQQSDTTTPAPYNQTGEKVYNIVSPERKKRGERTYINRATFNLKKGDNKIGVLNNQSANTLLPDNNNANWYANISGVTMEKIDLGAKDLFCATINNCVLDGCELKNIPHEILKTIKFKNCTFANMDLSSIPLNLIQLHGDTKIHESVTLAQGANLDDLKKNADRIGENRYDLLNKRLSDFAQELRSFEEAQNEAQNEVQNKDYVDHFSKNGYKYEKIETDARKKDNEGNALYSQEELGSGTNASLRRLGYNVEKHRASSQNKVTRPSTSPAPSDQAINLGESVVDGNLLGG